MRLFAKWNIHHRLFGTSEERINLLNDLGPALTFDRDPSPFISREMIEDILKNIRAYMTAIDMFFDETETDYRDPHLRGDGDSLIYYLKRANAYDDNRVAGRVNPSTDRLI